MEILNLNKPLFNLHHTFFCGQCFRAVKKGSSITLPAMGRVINLCYDENLIIKNCSKEDFDRIWKKYLGFEIDYEKVYAQFSKDKYLTGIIMQTMGLRVLQQEFFETYISFILSANNNISRITRIIEKLCWLYGDVVEFEGEKYHLFPTPLQLADVTETDLAPISAGYRAAYVVDAVKRYMSGDIDEQKLRSCTIDEARKQLMQVKGIGNKVANCILLFALGHYEAFPLDVWMKRAMLEHYGLDPVNAEIYAKKTYGKYAGIAQQYLFQGQRLQM